MVQAPGQVQRGSGGSEGSGEGLLALHRFNRVPEKVPEKAPEKVPGSLGAKPSQVQQGSEKVPQKVPEKVWEASVQSQVKFNRVPENVPVKVGEALVQSQADSTGFRRRFRRLWCRARSGSTGFQRRFRRRFREALVQRQVRFNRICGHLTHGNPAEVFPAFGLAARFRKICKNEMLRLLGIPPKLIAVANFPSRVLCWVSALCSIPWISLRALLWTISNGTKICMQVNLATRTVAHEFEPHSKVNLSHVSRTNKWLRRDRVGTMVTMASASYPFGDENWSTNQQMG